METTTQVKQELEYLMKYFGVQKVPVIRKTTYCGKESKEHLGVIRADMQYDTKYSLRSYKREYEHLAYEDALSYMRSKMEELKGLRENINKPVHTRLVYSGDYGTRLEKNYDWKSDFAKAGVEVTHDEEGNVVLTGTICCLASFISYANDHMRYCNGCRYTYESDEVNSRIKLFREFGFPDNYDWTHVGIVD